jgi:hypothetical protein
MRRSPAAVLAWLLPVLSSAITDATADAVEWRDPSPSPSQKSSLRGKRSSLSSSSSSSTQQYRRYLSPQFLGQPGSFGFYSDESGISGFECSVLNVTTASPSGVGGNVTCSLEGVFGVIQFEDVPPDPASSPDVAGFFLDGLDSPQNWWQTDSPLPPPTQWSRPQQMSYSAILSIRLTSPMLGTLELDGFRVGFEPQGNLWWVGGQGVEWIVGSTPAAITFPFHNGTKKQALYGFGGPILSL